MDRWFFRILRWLVLFRLALLILDLVRDAGIFPHLLVHRCSSPRRSATAAGHQDALPRLFLWRLLLLFLPPFPFFSFDLLGPFLVFFALEFSIDRHLGLHSRRVVLLVIVAVVGAIKV